MGLALGLMMLCAAIVMCYMALPRDGVALLSDRGGLGEFYVVVLVTLLCLGSVLVLSAF